MSNKKIALVTGGNGGIGQAICIALADKGHIVVAGYFPADKKNAEQWQSDMQSKGYSISLAAADVTNFDDTQRMIQDVETTVGPIDILVNCAGITRDSSLKKMDVDAWQSVIDTNLNSAFNVTKPVMTGMMSRGFGRVVNISSVNGQRGQFGQPNYSAAKAGLHGFTMAAAREGARKGVTVNTVSPGYVETSMTAAIPESVLESIVNEVPMGRMAQPEEIAHTVVWLADENSAYITGANIPVNGGLFMSF